MLQPADFLSKLNVPHLLLFYAFQSVFKSIIQYSLKTSCFTKWETERQRSVLLKVTSQSVVPGFEPGSQTLKFEAVSSA